MRSVFVAGTPIAKGNLRRNRWGASYDATKGLSAWSELVRGTVAAECAGAEPEAGAVALRVTFWLPRPASHFGTGRNRERLREAAPRVPTTRPDVDKLLRAVLDAMKGTVYHDDGQVVSVHVIKSYCERRPGVLIEWAPATHAAAEALLAL